MALVTITFEVNDDSPLIDGCENVQDSLHEALCLFIHENDEDAFAMESLETTVLSTLNIPNPYE